MNLKFMYETWSVDSVRKKGMRRIKIEKVELPMEAMVHLGLTCPSHSIYFVLVLQNVLLLMAIYLGSDGYSTYS
jgi:hypothetical protein